MNFWTFVELLFWFSDGDSFLSIDAWNGQRKYITKEVRMFSCQRGTLVSIRLLDNSIIKQMEYSQTSSRPGHEKKYSCSCVRGIPDANGACQRAALILLSSDLPLSFKHKANIIRKLDQPQFLYHLENLHQKNISSFWLKCDLFVDFSDKSLSENRMIYKTFWKPSSPKHCLPLRQLLAPKVLLEYLWPRITIPSHPSTYSNEDDLS